MRVNTKLEHLNSSSRQHLDGIEKFFEQNKTEKEYSIPFYRLLFSFRSFFFLLPQVAFSFVEKWPMSCGRFELTEPFFKRLLIRYSILVFVLLVLATLRNRMLSNVSHYHWSLPVIMWYLMAGRFLFAVSESKQNLECE